MSDAGQPGASREEAGSPEGGGDGDAGTQRKQWTQLEDDTVRRLVHEHGTRAWTTVAQALPGRTGKQIRERWATEPRGSPFRVLGPQLHRLSAPRSMIRR